MVCFSSWVLRADSGDLQLGVRLTVAGLATVVLPASELEDHELRTLVLRLDLRLHRRTAHERLADFGGVAADEEDLAEGDFVARAAGQLLDAERLPFGDSVLFAARPD